jgi:hypothetical protein
VYWIINKIAQWRSAKVVKKAPNSVITSLPITNNINISQTSAKYRNTTKNANITIAEPLRYEGNSNLRIWLNSFDRYAVDIAEERRYDALFNLLTKEIQAVVARYQYSDDDCQAFQQLRGVLINLYGRDITPIDPIIELSTRVQMPNESLQQFAGELEALARSGFPVDQTEFADKLVASQFKNGINNPWVRKEVMLAKMTNLKDLLEEAIRVEDVFKRLLKPPNTDRTLSINMIQQEIQPNFECTFSGQQQQQSNEVQNSNPHQFNKNNYPNNNAQANRNKSKNWYRNNAQSSNSNFNSNSLYHSQTQANQNQSQPNQFQQNQPQQIQSQQNQSQQNQPNQNSTPNSSGNGILFGQRNFNINTIQKSDQNSFNKLNIRGTCLINSNLVDFQADSGADVTVISQETYQQIKREESS